MGYHESRFQCAALFNPGTQLPRVNRENVKVGFLSTDILTGKIGDAQHKSISCALPLVNQVFLIQMIELAKTSHVV